VTPDVFPAVDGGQEVPFFGVFLLPFSAGGADVYLTYELLSTESAGVQLTGATPVKAYEFAIGYPTARFDIYFFQ
jgi:hypothetical protein